ncbi:adenine-specific methyltransferase EcoRI family protein [Hoeflea sp.]|uniref:adenine-specific methyltransferase EcoRI family protein n=1 Tax=Hoeflea sp. TaxID=1940281 RepID=UPI003B016AE8
MNENLSAARKAKNDEFYTQLGDIENELRHYRQHFRDKIVYCNCDDPRVSNFFHYFSHNFHWLGLRKLITTCYKNQEPDLFSRHDAERAIRLDYDGFRDGETVPRPEDIGITQLEGDGDFRSAECIEILKQADIVVTNPPFSLFRDYVAQMIEYDKKFLIIGNKNAITYKEIFPLISGNYLWVGNTSMSQDLLFDVPPDYAKELTCTKKERSAYKLIDGVVKGRSQSIWFTNLDHKKRHEELILYRSYTPEDYPTYDNYDAIEVSKTADIPTDWPGAMGVPITFLDKYNPDQFEILGVTDRDNNSGLKTREYTTQDVSNPGDLNRRATSNSNFGIFGILKSLDL